MYKAKLAYVLYVEIIENYVINLSWNYIITNKIKNYIAKKR